MDSGTDRKAILDSSVTFNVKVTQRNTAGPFGGL